MLAAAAELFEESGWAGTTVAAIAERAGVAVETVYSGFGSKKRCCAQVIDFAVVGDTEPVPLAEREVFTELAEGARDARIDAGIEMLTDIHGRLAKVWRTVGEAAASDRRSTAGACSGRRGGAIDTRRSIELILRRNRSTTSRSTCCGGSSATRSTRCSCSIAGSTARQYVERIHEAVTRLVALIPRHWHAAGPERSSWTVSRRGAG